MKILHTPLALAGLMLLPATSFAVEKLSYTYGEIDYITQDVDLFEDDDAFDNILEDINDGDGFRIHAQYEFPRNQWVNNVYIFGNYSNTHAEFTFTNDTGMEIQEDEDIKTMSIGLGYHMPIANNMDFVTQVAYQDVDFGDIAFGQNETDIDDFDDVGDAIDDLDEDSTDGFFIDAGVRSQVVNWMEAGAGLRYTDLDTGDDFSIFANALFEINPNMGVNVAAEFGDNVDIFRVGFRYSM